VYFGESRIITTPINRPDIKSNNGKQHDKDWPTIRPYAGFARSLPPNAQRSVLTWWLAFGQGGLPT